MKVSEDGRAFIKRNEGYSAAPYKDVAGLWTGGYGHLFKEGENIRPRSRTTWDHVFDLDLKPVEKLWNEVNFERMQRNRLKLQQHKFDALCDFTFNVGVGATRRSEFYDRAMHDNQEHPYLPSALLTWTKAGGVRVEGLVTRRAREYFLYMFGYYRVTIDLR